jgi:NADH dehydrogenase
VRVFVTGATGFVGPAVANAIADAGHDLRVLERKPGAWMEAGIRCQVAVQGDVTDPDSLRPAVRDADVVVHLVAIRQGRPQDFERVMIAGTRNLIAAAKELGIKRFVLMSALGTTAETKDLVPYYNAKWTQEQDLEASGLEYVIFRPSFIFGREGGILPTFRKLARLMPVTPIMGPGTQRIQPIWIDDVAAYFAQSVDKPEVANRAFELGGPDQISWNEFWARLKRTLGLRRPSLHVPMGLARANALVTERLPGNIPLTRDLLKMLEAGDNVVSNDDAVRTFELPLVPLDEQLRRAA